MEKQHRNIIPYLIAAVLILGIALKIIYVQRVPFSVSPHDLGKLGDWNDMDRERSLTFTGHLSYIQYIYKFHRFPHSYADQLYHPPLFHIFGAVVVKIWHDLGNDFYSSLECLQFLNMLISSASAVFIFLTMKRLKVRGIPLLAATAIVSFHPVFYNIGAALNNDALAATLGIAAIYFTTVWFFENRTYQIILIALCVGLGMFTKLSAGLTAPAIALVFLYKVIRSIQANRNAEKKDLSLLWQLLLFAVICLPIGLYWSVRNIVVHHIPVNYVLRLPEDCLQYVGSMPLIKRIGLPTPEQMTTVRLKFDPETSSNIWSQTVLTSAFDEKIIKNEKGIAKSLSILYLWLCWFSGIATNLLAFYGIFKGKIQTILKAFFAAAYLTICIFYLKFCFDYPFICTMNFRYLVIALGMGAILFAIGCSAEEGQKHIGLDLFKKAAYSGIFLWSVLGSALYFCFY